MGNLLKVIASSSLLSLMDDILSALTSAVIGPLLWGLCDIFFLIIDMFDSLYRKFAGISEITIQGQTVDQDPVLYLINTNIVQEMFFSIVTLSMILLIIFTIFAIVKNIYAEKPKPLGEILRSMTKALLMYLLVPIATIVCLLVGNVVLRAIDGATKLSGANGTSDMLFLSAAYNANKLRDDDTAYAMKTLEDMVKDGRLTPINWGKNQSNSRVEKYIATMNANGVDVIEREIEFPEKVNLDEVATAVDEAYVSSIIGDVTVVGSNKWGFWNVMHYYYIIKINLITVWAGGVFIIFALGKITWGLISRLFKMTVYYAISPALMAMFPIKGDAVLKSWTGEMVKNATMAYCAIGVLNVVFSVLPAFSNLKIFGFWPLDGFAVLFINIVALTSAEKLISTVSGWFGTGDALAEGKAAEGGVKKPVTGVAKKSSGVFAGMAGGWGAAKNQQKGFFGKMGGAFQGAMSQTGFAKMRQDTQKQWQDAKKGGGDYYENVKTKDWKGEDKQAFQTDEDGNYVRKGLRRVKDPKTTRADEFKGRQKVAEENKKLEELLPAYRSETDPVKKEILLNKIKSISSVVAERIKDAEEEVQVMEKKIQSKKESISAFEKVSATGTKRESIANRIFGYDADEMDLAALESGDLSTYSPEIQARYAQYAEMYNNADLDFQEAKSDLITLAKTDEATKDMLTELSMTVADLQGLSVGVDSVTGDRNLAYFESKLKLQTDGIQDMKNDVKALKKDIKDNIPKHAQDSLDDKVDSKTYGKIGKNKK